jgi:hypothetical protein
VSWQIVPTILQEMMLDTDPERNGRVMRAMLTMIKLDIKALQQAYETALTSCTNFAPSGWHSRPAPEPVTKTRT